MTNPRALALSQGFLALVGLLYLGLALWCAVDPVTTSAKVGFERIGDSGASEFLTVYGGLEFGMAWVFLAPCLRRDWTVPSLAACLAIHASLVLFRSIGFWLYPEPASMTFRLALGEWVIFLTAAGLLGWLSQAKRGK